MKVWIFATIAAVLWAMAMYLTKKNGSEKAEPILFQLYQEKINNQIVEYKRSGDFLAAEKMMLKAIKKFPKARKAYFDLVEILYLQEKYESALAYLLIIRGIMKASFEPDPSDYFSVLVRIVQTKIRIGDLDGASKAAIEILESGEGGPFIGLIYADIALQQGNTTEQLNRLEKMSVMYPHDSETKLALSLCYHSLGKSQRSEQLLEELMREFPHTIGPFVYFARAAVERKDWEEAVRRWQIVQERFVLNPEGFEQGAAALRQLGREDLAAVTMEKHPGEHAVPWPLRFG